jgi:hypothetical protein
VATSGSDANSCTQLAPCKSFQRAYNVAQPGQIVEVAAGSYPSQSITGTKATPNVVFQGGSGVAVDFSGGNAISADNITFDGPMRLSWIADANASGLVFQGVSHTWFGIQSAQNVKLLGGESYCPAANGYCDYDPQITNQYQYPTSPSDILIDGVNFHDWRRPAGSDWHTECLQVGSGLRVEIRNSTFQRCATHDIFVRSWGVNHLLQGFNIHHNLMYATDIGYFTMQFEADLYAAGCLGNAAHDNQIGQAFRPPTVPCILYSNNLPIGSG